MDASDIIAFRKGLGMRQVDLAKALGVSKNTVSRWERGACRISKEAERKLLLLVGPQAQDEAQKRHHADMELYEITPEKVKQVFASIAFDTSQRPKDRVAAARELGKMMGLYSMQVKKRTVYFNLNLAGNTNGKNHHAVAAPT